MPLVIVVGLPCSGKTRRALAIEHELKTAGKTVHVVSDDSVGVARTVYADAALEKAARGRLLSAIERLLSRDAFVIADSLNYIKGFRYQLHCIAKSLATAQHTVYCIATDANVREWNAACAHYSPSVLDALLGRLEEPDARNRWDSPLLSLMPSDPLPESFIHSLLHSSIKQQLAPSHSIALKPVAETNYLHEMDLILKAICDKVLEACRNGDAASGLELKVPGAELKVRVPSKGTSVSEMGRMRRLYAANLNRLTIQVDRTKIGDGFVEFINQNLR